MSITLIPSSLQVFLIIASQPSPLAVARTGIGYEIFNEAVDSGYIRSKTLGENEMQRVLDIVGMGEVRICVVQGI